MREYLLTLLLAAAHAAIKAEVHALTAQFPIYQA